MAEILSIPASVIGLVQGIELARKSLVLISELRGAPAEVNRISRELQQVQTIIQALDSYVHGSSASAGLTGESARLLQSHLLCFKADLDEFGKLINPHLNDKTSLARFKIRLKWCAAGLDKKLIHVSKRLTAHGMRLQLVLSLYTSDQIRQSSTQAQRQMGILTESQDLQSTVIHELAKGIRTSCRPSANLPNSHHPRQTTIVQGSAKIGAALLNDVAPVLYSLFSDSLVSGFSPDRVEWVMSMVWGLLCDVLYGRVEESAATGGLLRTQLSQDRGDPWDGQLPANSSTLSAVPHKSFDTKTVSMRRLRGVYSVEFHLTLFDYGLPSSYPDDAVSHCRLYAAAKDTLQSGVVVHLREGLRTHCPVLKSLATFRMHPNNSPIFQHMKNGDIDVVRRMLSLAIVSANDRDEDGNTLLWHSLRDFNNYDICEMLLQYQADPADCNKQGDHALAIIVANLFGRSSQVHEDGSAAVKLVDLLLRYCHAGEVHSTLRYKRRKGFTLAPAGLIHSAIPRQACSTVAYIPHLFRLCLLKHVDLELTDKNGNTALLHALFYLPLPALLDAADSLLVAGADTAAKNNYGEGCLHLLLRRLTSCSIPNIDAPIRKRIVSLLVGLTQRGCDPVEGNIAGYTPIDAAMSPVAWPLLCTAMNQAGHDMKGSLRLLDLAARIDSLSDLDVEEKVQQVLDQRAISREQQLAPIRLSNMCSEDQGTFCYVCGRPSDPSLRDPPFDEFFSDVVDELGHGIHMVMYRHPSMEECLHIHEEDSTHHLDYHPMEMTRDRLYERSWRRHVAYVLWERGLLED
ncbi:hypothetical protein QBC35DRAFT_541754 [Podospora australis]|uniref:Fungal N-terminal domain-containing protein n=1 Tax=Podospora australis TaxID=1536484 RepID=A0AAN7AFF8_9PEZI|nr:hypothetical protein QBC35DRAFT_541754 [Podospora australis]